MLWLMLNLTIYVLVVAILAAPAVPLMYMLRARISEDDYGEIREAEGLTDKVLAALRVANIPLALKIFASFFSIIYATFVLMSVLLGIGAMMNEGSEYPSDFIGHWLDSFDM